MFKKILIANRGEIALRIIYVPGIGGVRLEDDVLVTTTGCEVLTR